MKSDEENLDVLQNLEFAIVQVWRACPEMTDYTALNAYEAARQLYRAELRGHVPKTPALNGLDATAFEALKQICEFRLGRHPGPPSEEQIPVTPISVETLMDCLKTIIKSVELHTKLGGRKGYLSFIDGFLP